MEFTPSKPTLKKIKKEKVAGRTENDIRGLFPTRDTHGGLLKQTPLAVLESTLLLHLLITFGCCR